MEMLYQNCYLCNGAPGLPFAPARMQRCVVQQLHTPTKTNPRTTAAARGLDVGCCNIWWRCSRLGRGPVLLLLQRLGQQVRLLALGSRQPAEVCRFAQVGLWRPDLGVSSNGRKHRSHRDLLPRCVPSQPIRVVAASGRGWPDQELNLVRRQIGDRPCGPCGGPQAGGEL